MKLVEILAKEVQEWPEDARYSIQDSDGEVKFGAGNDPEPDAAGRVWIRDESSDQVYIDAPISSDRETAIVTVEQWQAERDKLIQPQANEVDMKGPFPCAPAGDPLNTIEYDIEFP